MSYGKFHRALADFIDALDKVTAEQDESDGLTPYVQYVPVLLDDDIVGFLVDDIGAAYQFEQVTPELREWWNARPGFLGGAS